jgi:chaperone modulatory protein CbpM
MKAKLITITEYCINYDIEPEFISSLDESGIITLTIIDTEKYIDTMLFDELDKYIHLHYDLHINIEGIDAIRHLLNKVDRMQGEILELKSRLHLHE